jgi:hypothetical protein
MKPYPVSFPKQKLGHIGFLPAKTAVYLENPFYFSESWLKIKNLRIHSAISPVLNGKHCESDSARSLRLRVGKIPYAARRITALSILTLWYIVHKAAYFCQDPQNPLPQTSSR